ncbi:Uncharacterized protein MLTONO_5316 [Mesorhizobium loti]|nr:Uncharacterized protein MLTONO_5316 [Mesorhizobium loti]
MLDVALIHHHDSIRHRERFTLIVCDEDHSYSKGLLKALQLKLHMLAKLFVKRTKRFVHEDYAWAKHKCASQGNSLLLAAG